MRIATFVAVSLASLGWSTVAGAAEHVGRAHTTSTLAAADTAHLHLVRSSGSTLIEEGSASAGLPGHMRANLEVGATFSGSFTFYTRFGELVGHGAAKPHGSGRYESFAGSMVVTGGTGRYTHARGRAGLYGVFDRKTYAVTMQTTGSVSY
jgi:hypothetical protein